MDEANAPLDTSAQAHPAAPAAQAEQPANPA